MVASSQPFSGKGTVLAIYLNVCLHKIYLKNLDILGKKNKVFGYLSETRFAFHRGGGIVQKDSRKNHSLMGKVTHTGILFKCDKNCLVK